jgi:hypothetical protein
MGGRCCAKKIFILATNKVLKLLLRNPWRTGYVPVFSSSDDEKELICSVIGS